MRVCLAVAAAVVVALLVWPSAIAQAPAPILRCYHHGEVVAAAPVPAPPDFKVRLSGPVTSAEWTLAGGQRVVLATTTPCLYLITSPPAGARGAGGP